MTNREVKCELQCVRASHYELPGVSTLRAKPSIALKGQLKSIPLVTIELRLEECVLGVHRLQTGLTELLTHCGSALVSSPMDIASWPRSQYKGTLLSASVTLTK